MPTITEDFMKKLQEDAIPLITEAYCRGMKIEEFNKFVKEVYDQLEKERGNAK
jgi:DNA-binding transcriptional regulator YhcF (GntR family)